MSHARKPATKKGAPQPRSGQPAEVAKQAGPGPVRDGTEPRVGMPARRAISMSEPGDKHEREAEAVAEDVVSGRKATPVTRAMEPMRDPMTEVRTAKEPGSQVGGGAEDQVRKALDDRGRGRPMAPAMRAAIEQRTGADLSDARIHDDATAVRAAQAIDARAFTQGDDIFLGQGESDQDLGLMAHEAAHVAQQRGDDRDSPVHRLAEGATVPTPTDPGASHEREPHPVRRAKAAKGRSAPDEGDGDAGSIKGMKIVLNKVAIPEWKYDFTKRKTGLDIPKTGKRNTDQTAEWARKVKPGMRPKLVAQLESSKAIHVGDKRMYFFAYTRGTGYVLGSRAALLNRIIRPEWDKSGKPHYFDVDHKQEMQLAGEDEIANMWLLDARINQETGSQISAAIEDQISRVLDKARKTLGNKVPDSARAARATHEVTIANVVAAPARKPNDDDSWEPADIEAGEPLESLRLMSEDEAKKAGLIDPTATSPLLILASGTGGGSVTIPWNLAANRPEGNGPWPLFSSFKITEITWKNGKGSITGGVFEGNPLLEDSSLTVDLEKHPSLTHAAVVNGRNIESKLRKFGVRGLSPVKIEVAELRDPVGLYLRGKVLPTIPPIMNVGIDLVIEGDDVYLEKSFTSADLTFSGPIAVTGTSLAIAGGFIGGHAALRVTGGVSFAVERVGEGNVRAQAELSAEGVKFALEGDFDFDTKLFDQATVNVWYRPPTFGGGGRLEIKEGKISGIRGARLDVAFDNERIEAKGSVDVAIKGVDRGDLAVTYEKDKGLLIAGSLKLSEDIPGIKGGTLEASLRQKEDGAWALGGDISAETDIPGVAGTVTGKYDDGAFQIEGTLGYAKGMLQGSLTLGATNQRIGDDGKPTGTAGDRLTAYGGGLVNVKLAPWLQGTVGLRIKPDGGVVVTGKVGLPSELELFPKKNLTKNIFTINIDIPIVGLTVLGQRVGVFATVGGGLDAQAGIGPGKLTKAELGVTYDPGDEAATKVTGAAKMSIPAHAGLGLFVTGGVGAGIPLVSATAGLKVGGALGIQGALESDLQVNWTPSSGLVIDAWVGASAKPSFTFDVTGFAKVTVDYVVGTETLYDQRWQLASVQYGSDLTFGLKLPLHYEEGKAFDIALSDIEFQYPEIDTTALLRGLVKKIA
ncbi:DUF4157 domain-containing protein [Nonomuraea sp. NPDC052116]|uniref:eCIS core domain-containing protein n=1 Tax=Nonomuraea sp. NPDC052116 TaxID=3155665 RepID=UPI003436064F